jgi:hypothetical protein
MEDDMAIESVLMQGYQLFTGAKNAQPFSTEKEAIDWLVQDTLVK